MNSSKPKLAFGMNVPGWRAWLGLIVAPMVWGLHHQLGSNMSYAACDRGPDKVALTVGVIGLLVIAATAWTGWLAWQRAGGIEVEEADALEVFIPLLSVMAATLFGLTIFVQLLADLLLPSCFA